MEKKKITYRKLLELKSAVDHIDITKRDKFTWTIDEFKDNIHEHLEYYYKEVDKINRKYCSLDRDGNFFISDKGVPILTKFNKNTIADRDKDLEKLLATELEITVSNCEDLSRINTLHISFLKLLNGFLFNITHDHMQDLYSNKPLEPASNQKN